jgi:hypothetical protein
MPLIVNGWPGYHAHNEASEAVFAGVHLARQEGAQARWIGHSKYVSGSRDPYTQGLLQTFGIRSEMIGCATLTFDRYRGIRRGRYRIDALAPEHVTPLTNHIPDIDWVSQWTLASELLAILRHAALVVKRGGDPAKGLASRRSMAELGTVVSQDLYGDFEAEARKRLGARDPEDWPILAAALAVGCPIWTADTDFFGCGVATWTSASIGSFFGQ